MKYLIVFLGFLIGILAEAYLNPFAGESDKPLIMTESDEMAPEIIIYKTGPTTHTGWMNLSFEACLEDYYDGNLTKAGMEWLFGDSVWIKIEALEEKKTYLAGGDVDTGYSTEGFRTDIIFEGESVAWVIIDSLTHRPVWTIIDTLKFEKLLDLELRKKLGLDSETILYEGTEYPATVPFEQGMTLYPGQSATVKKWTINE